MITGYVNMGRVGNAGTPKFSEKSKLGRAGESHHALYSIPKTFPGCLGELLNRMSWIPFTLIWSPYPGSASGSIPLEADPGYGDHINTIGSLQILFSSVPKVGGNLKQNQYKTCSTLPELIIHKKPVFFGGPAFPHPLTSPELICSDHRASRTFLWYL